MKKFFIAGWLPVLTDKLVLREKKSGWNFTQTADQGKCYVAYKFSFDNSTPSIVTGLDLCYRHDLNFSEKFSINYHKNSDEKKRGEIYNRYYRDSSLSSTVKSTFSYNEKNGILKIDSSSQQDIDDSQLRSIATLILALVRDLFHMHFHHSPSADTCLEPIISDSALDYSIIIEKIKEQYRNKFINFKKASSQIVEFNEKINSLAVFSKKSNKDLAFLENYRGELIYAKSFASRCLAKEDGKKSFEDFICQGTDSLEVKYQYCTNLRNHFISLGTYLLTILTLFSCVITLIYTLWEKFC